MEERLIELLRLALKHNATDIHFSTNSYETNIEMRIGGDLLGVKGKHNDHQLLKYLKYMSSMDIEDKDRHYPQTGTFQLIVDNTKLELRFAILENNNTANAVLKILKEEK